MTSTTPGIFENVRTRYFVLAWLLLPFSLPGANLLFEIIDFPLAWYSWDLAYIYYAHLLMAAIIALTAILPEKLPIRLIVGKEPSKSVLASGLLLSVYLFVLAWPAAYILFLPLSYWSPEFVQYWYIDSGELVYLDYGNFPLIANLLSLISLCVLAPIIEEFAFRGVILHRWTHKFGLRTGIIASSLLFGIVHADPLGAFFFGVGMCVLYLRTQSLVLPMMCHSAYNLVVWLFDLGYKLKFGPDSRHTLEDFQGAWPIGLAAFVIVAVWTRKYLKRSKADITWKLPVT